MSARIRPVVVLFRPSAADIASLVGLAAGGWNPVAVINEADRSQVVEIAAAGVDTIANTANVGLARALNQGIEHVFASGADYVMLLDQDTRPPASMMAALLERAEQVVAEGGRLGCIGPRPVDRKASARPPSGRAAPTAVDTVITSGQVIPRTAHDEVGGMWNELFIDCIDHEWCFRARARGLSVLMAQDVAMPHDMGDVAVGPRGHESILHRSPVRHFHIVRNALWMQRCAHIPRAWRLGELARLAYLVPTFLAVSTDRRASADAIRRGWREGLVGPPARSYSAASAASSIAG